MKSSIILVSQKICSYCGLTQIVHREVYKGYLTKIRHLWSIQAMHKDLNVFHSGDKGKQAME